MIDPIGTIGSAPCERALNKVLAEYNDPKITNKVVKKYLVVKSNIKKLTKYIQDNDPVFYVTMLGILRDHTWNQLDPVAFSTDIYSHLECCILRAFAAAYANHSKLVKNNTSVPLSTTSE